jgi:hypothetical protein
VWDVRVCHIKVHFGAFDAEKAEPAASMLLNIVFALVEGRLFDKIDGWVVHQVLSGLYDVWLLFERISCEVVGTRCAPKWVVYRHYYLI